MRVEELVKAIMNITDKYKQYQADPKTEDFYYDVLHVSLSEIINSIPKDAWDKAPITVKNTVQKLLNKIYKSTSFEYKEDYKAQQKQEEADKKNGNPPKKKYFIGFDGGENNNYTDNTDDLTKN